MTTWDNKVPYEQEYYYSGCEEICPVCGGRIKHPYTGAVSSEQLDEDSECCLWMEVCDEGDGCLGYTPICRNIHPYTLPEEDNEYIHYDLIELANTWDMHLHEKVEKLISLITGVFDGIERKDVRIIFSEDKITDIVLSKPLKNISITLSVDEEGNIQIIK